MLILSMLTSTPPSVLRSSNHEGRFRAYTQAAPPFVDSLHAHHPKHHGLLSHRHLLCGRPWSLAGHLVGDARSHHVSVCRRHIYVLIFAEERLKEPQPAPACEPHARVPSPPCTNLPFCCREPLARPIPWPWRRGWMGLSLGSHQGCMTTPTRRHDSKRQAEPSQPSVLSHGRPDFQLVYTLHPAMPPRCPFSSQSYTHPTTNQTPTLICSALLAFVHSD